MAENTFVTAYDTICRYIGDETENDDLQNALDVVDSYINFLEQWIIEYNDGYLSVEDLFGLFEEDTEQ